MFLTTRERPGAPTLSAKARNLALLAVIVLASALAFGGAMLHAPDATHAVQAIHHAATACGAVNLPCIPIRP